MKHIFYFLFTFSLSVSTLQHQAHCASPADRDVAGNSECQVQAGSVDEVTLPIPKVQGIAVTVRTSISNGLIIRITLHVPQNMGVQFQSNSFSIKDFVSGKVFSKKVSSIYEGDFEYSPDKLEGKYKMDIFSKIGSKFPKSYSVFLVFEEIKPEQFKLILPGIRIDNTSYDFLSLCFDRTVYDYRKIQAPSDNLFVARSRDFPNPSWIGLDATVTEVKKGERVSLFKISKSKGTEGAGAIGRFLFCCITAIADNRGFRYFVNSEPVDDHVLVGFLKSSDEDIKGIIGEQFNKYHFYDVADVQLFRTLCGFNP